MIRLRFGALTGALLVGTACLPFNSALAATYYVDSVAGLDAYNGTTTGTPWKTLAKVNGTMFLPGDNVLFKRGSSWTGSLIPWGNGNSTAQLVFGAYGTGVAPIINGNGVNETVWLSNKSYFTLQDLAITNNAASEGNRAGIRVSFKGSSTSAVTTFRGVKILNNEISQVRGTTIRANNIYATGAIMVKMMDDGGVLTYVDDLLIQGNDIHDNWCIGINVAAPGNYGGREDLWGTNFIIRDNIIDQGGADGIVVLGANAPLIERNASYDACILEAPGAGSFSAGMWTSYFTKDAVFQFNEVARCYNAAINGASGDSQAFDADLGTTGNQIFQYNYTHDNDGGVLIMMSDPTIAKTVIYRYNLSVNDARNTNTGDQMSVLPTFGVNSAHIYNNVFYSTRQEGFKFSDAQAAYYTNNIFSMPAAIYPSRPTFTNNCYFGHTPVVTDHYKVLGDPQFVGPLPTASGGDGYTSANVDMFKLKSTSPCINWGASIADNGGVDFWGNPLYAGTYADIGLHELVGGNHPAPAPVTITDNPASGTVTYTGSGWIHSSSENLYYNRTRSYTPNVGDAVQFTFTGTNASVYGVKGLGMGKISVSVDGGPAVLLDNLSPVSLIYRTELFQVSGLAPGTHTIKVTNATKNSYSTWNGLGIDYFLTVPGTPPSSPVASYVDNTPSSSVVYSGTWWTSGTGDSKCWYGTKSTSSTVGDYVDFTFVGTGVRVCGIKASSYGKLSFSVDGGTPTVVNCYQGTLADYLVNLFEVNGLASGTHTIRATVATKDAASSGNTVAIDYFQKLTGGGPISVAPVADTFVRDGTYATTNYGTSTSLDVKLDVANYHREAFCKFNVSGFSNAGRAILKLVPVLINTDTAVTYTVEFVSNDTWTESGMIWNNRPAGSGVVLGTLSGTTMQLGVPINIDITNQVRTEAAGDGTISIMIRSNNLGSLKNAGFGSRENAAANQPQLIIQ